MENVSLAMTARAVTFIVAKEFTVPMLQLLLLLLPIATFSAWLAGLKRRQSTETDLSSSIPHNYFLGLNYLINEQPDKAVDVFVKMLAVNSDTVETHLALGNLFRKRGEVDRAIRIHQNVIARPTLPHNQRVLALLELAQDYFRAGMLDRAEKIFLELIDLKEEVATSLHYLLNIYQQQKDWQQAIVIAHKIAANSAKMQIPLSHYCCELAEKADLVGQFAQAEEYLQQALEYDPNCVRANIIAGKIAMQRGDYQQAINLYQQIRAQDADYLTEVIGYLAVCYHKLDLKTEFIQYLHNCLIELPRIPIIIMLSKYIKEQSGHTAAIDFIAMQMKRCLSLRGVNHLLELHLAMQPELALLQESVKQLLDSEFTHRCSHCGFAGKQLYWLCPSCKRWSTIKPISTEPEAAK